VPAPGSPRRAIFVDRDGVINDLAPDPRSGRPESPLAPGDVRLIPGVAEGLRRLREAGYLLIGVSNQPAAAKGMVTVENLLAVHARVVSLLSDEEVVLDDWRLCLHHPDGSVPELTGVCDCRKPAPGLLLDAARRTNIDLGGSWMIGDTDSDIVAGHSAGCRTVLIEHPASTHKRAGMTSPDLRARDLAHAACLVAGGASGCREA
jgi:D-glycero-D-manno-heptose 1,7-bisphosphate phosphatase